MEGLEEALDGGGHGAMEEYFTVYSEKSSETQGKCMQCYLVRIVLILNAGRKEARKSPDLQRLNGFDLDIQYFDCNPDKGKNVTGACCTISPGPPKLQDCA